MVRVCFVCLGNICRSPTAEGIFRARVAAAGLESHYDIDSAGTAAYHVGERADPRSRAYAVSRGVPLDSRGRKFVRADFDRFDHVIAMDHSNRDALLRLAPDDTARAKVSLMRDWDPAGPKNAEVPDPYYGDGDGFQRVFDICDAACRGFLEQTRR